jgi:TRAP-type uncharacterized transport system substrate-binding protein
MTVVDDRPDCVSGTTYNPATPMDGRTNMMHWLEGKIVYSVGFGVIVLLLIGVSLFYFGGIGPSSPHVVRIAYGAGGPVRKYFLEQMAVHGKKRNLDIRLVATEGTDQTLSLVDKNGADLGLIAGAIEDRASRDVLEIAPLYMEPLQLLVKGELYDSVVRDFGQLKGKSIGLDGQNSATNLLATELLRFIGLVDQATGKPQYQPVYIPQSQLADRKNGPSLPDAVFQIGGVPSPSIRTLIADHNYRLVPLPFGAPFSLAKFRESEIPENFASATLRLNKDFVEESVIPAFVYGVLPAVPPSDTRTIATRLVLVGGHRLDNQVVRRVLELILSPEISNLVKPRLTVELFNSSFQFERHPGTDDYLNSLKPFNVEGAFEAYSRLGEVWGLIIALYLAAAKGLKAWRKRKAQLPERSVGDFLSEVLAVEAAAHASCTHDERVMLDQQLSDIKKTSIELHLESRLKDSENLPSLLVTLADTRTRIWGPVSAPRATTFAATRAAAE